MSPKKGKIRNFVGHKKKNKAVYDIKNLFFIKTNGLDPDLDLT
jgi:hypothetical protein